MKTSFRNLVLFTSSLLLTSPFAQVQAHGYVTSPLPRMYREEGIDTSDSIWTKWMSTAGGNLAPGEGNAPNMNAAIPNGAAGIDIESTRG